MDYAILRTGSKQYTVRPGQIIDVDKLRAEEGSSVELSEVLAVSRDGDLTVGSPLVPNASVIAQVQAHDRDDKIIVFKYKRKVRYRRKKGHRQLYTRLAITAIMLGDEEVGVTERPDSPAPVYEEIPEAIPIAEDSPAEGPVDESVDDPEDGATDELVDEGGDEVIDGPRDEIEASPQDEAIDGPRDEVEGGTQDQPADEDRGGGER
jgi:large subunit ribosomal protein L21